MTEIVPDTLLTPAQVRTMFGGVSDMTPYRWYRWLSLPEMAFPKPIYIGRNRYWREAEIAAWQAAQAQAKAPEAVAELERLASDRASGQGDAA